MKQLAQITLLLAFLMAWLVAPRVCWAGRAVRPEQIDELFGGLKSTDAPGAAVLVLENGRAVFKRGYGVIDLRSLRKIDAHTNFRLASCTKQFTAMAIMLLVHDGKLHYEDRLATSFLIFRTTGIPSPFAIF